MDGLSLLTPPLALPAPADSSTLQLGQGVMALAAARLTDPSFSNRAVAVKQPSSYAASLTMAPVAGKPGQYQVQLPAGGPTGGCMLCAAGLLRWRCSR